LRHSEIHPTWETELKTTLSQPYTPDELERIKESISLVERLNQSESRAPGTFERLLDLARAEDAEFDE
jgi:hypothetical protein